MFREKEVLQGSGGSGLNSLITLKKYLKDDYTALSPQSPFEHMHWRVESRVQTTESRPADY